MPVEVDDPYGVERTCPARAGRARAQAPGADPVAWHSTVESNHLPWTGFRRNPGPCGRRMGGAVPEAVTPVVGVRATLPSPRVTRRVATRRQEPDAVQRRTAGATRGGGPR